MLHFTLKIRNKWKNIINKWNIKKEYDNMRLIHKRMKIFKFRKFRKYFRKN